MHKFIAVFLAVTGVLAAKVAVADAADFSAGLGCAANCVQSALVQTSVSAGRLDVKSDTPAKFDVVIRKRTAMDKVVAARQSPSFATTYTTFLLSLEPDTLYAIELTATDAQGRKNTRYGTFRTKKPQTVDGVNGADTLGSDAGCSVKCITAVDVTPGVTAARFEVKTNTPAKLRIEIEDGPTYSAEAGYLKAWNTALKQLRENRRYDVTVRATDANGNSAVATGSFETLQRNVRVRFMEIRVTENAEKRSSNKGEITFVGGVGRGWQVKRGESGIKDGKRVHFPSQGQVVQFDVRGPFSFQVQGMERDRKGLCFDYTPDPPYGDKSGSVKYKCVKKVWNTAEGKLDPATMFALDSSFEPGFEGAGTLDTTIYATDGAIRFYVDVRIDVWTE